MTKTRSKRSNKSKCPQQCSTPQNIKFGHGGAREGSGRPQRKPLPWPKDTDLTCIQGTDKFLQDLIKSVWTENVLDARTLSALNSTINMLLGMRGWLTGEIESNYIPAYYDDEEGEENDHRNETESTSEEIQKLTPDQQLEKLIEIGREVGSYVSPEQNQKFEEAVRKAKATREKQDPTKEQFLKLLEDT